MNISDENHRRSTWRDSGPERSGRPATPIGESIAGVVRRLGGPDAGLTTAVFGHWVEVVGPAVADHARPRSLREGVLTVEVDEPAWATQLRWLAPQILARVAEMAPPGSPPVTELVVRVAGERPPRSAGYQRPGRAGARRSERPR